MYSPITADLIKHLERLGHGPLLSLMNDPDVYKRNGVINVSALARRMSVSQNTARKIYMSLVDDARAELDKA